MLFFVNFVGADSRIERRLEYPHGPGRLLGTFCQEKLSMTVRVELKKGKTRQQDQTRLSIFESRALGQQMRWPRRGTV
jgi:hypothetical protein